MSRSESDPEADIGRENRIQGSRFQIAVREAKISLRSFALALLFCGTISTMTVADEVKRISVNGTELAYVELGQGEPIVFVHGGLQDYRMWSEHLPQFAERYRTIAYSRRNNYPNDVSPDGMPDGAADAHGDDLAALVRALGLKPRVNAGLFSYFLMTEPGPVGVNVDPLGEALGPTPEGL
jgi:hypothetical protein